MQSEMYPYINTESIEKLLGLVDRGLCSGLGHPSHKVCVEAAWFLARGGDPAALSDRNECVGSSVRNFRIRLNDSRWSSDKARSAGMRELAIAGLGSAHLDQRQFSLRVAVRFIRELLPDALRAAASIHPDQKHRDELERHAKICEEVPAAAAARAAAAAARAADAAARVAADADDADAVDAARAVAAGAADAAAAAADAGGGDQVLLKAATIATDILKDMGSEGSKFLRAA